MNTIRYILAIAFALLAMIIPNNDATLFDWLMWAGTMAVILLALNLATDNNNKQ